MQKRHALKVTCIISAHTQKHTHLHSPHQDKACALDSLTPLYRPGLPGITVMNGPEAPRKDALPAKEIHAAPQGVRSVGETVEKPKQSILYAVKHTYNSVVMVTQAIPCHANTEGAPTVISIYPTKASRHLNRVDRINSFISSHSVSASTPRNKRDKNLVLCLFISLADNSYILNEKEERQVGFLPSNNKKHHN